MLKASSLFKRYHIRVVAASKRPLRTPTLVNNSKAQCPQQCEALSVPLGLFWIALIQSHRDTDFFQVLLLFFQKLAQLRTSQVASLDLSFQIC